MFSIKRWWKTKDEIRVENVGKAVDGLMEGFSPEQLKSLGSQSGVMASFRDILFIDNRHKSPTLAIECYAPHSKWVVEQFEYLFEDPRNTIAAKEVFLSVFSRVFC